MTTLTTWFPRCWRALALVAWLVVGCATPATDPESLAVGRPLQPEAASTQQALARAPLQAERHAVAAANPLATEAGLQVLRQGGSAVDAAVAVQMVLTLVEPQSSGIGGGAFLLYFDGRRVEAFDGRETAPAAADEALFLQADGQPMPFQSAVVGGRAVGVPGTVRLLETAHRQHGRLPWATLFEPAIQLAEQGFALSPRLHTLLKGDPHLRRDPEAAAYFYQAGGEPWPVGHRLKNPALAQVLRQIARDGARGLMEGPMAQAMVDKVQGHPGNPGRLSLADLAGYQVKRREPLCVAHAVAARHYRICGFPPPSSGAIAIGQILGLLQRTDALALPLQEGLPGPAWLHLYTESARLAFADRAQYLADPDFVAAPAGDWRSLLATAYLDERARLIGPARMKATPPGQPGGGRVALAPMPEQPERGTSHISIVDGDGHALAMTTTIEDAFGARQMVHGFLLNNELTDFSFAPRGADGRPVANRVQPGKRPRSSMAPTLVFDADSGQLLMTTGSPGGALIIHFVTKVLYAGLHWGLGPQEAIALPNFGAVAAPSLLEAGRFPAATVQALQALGHEVREPDMVSGLQAITRLPGPGVRWTGGADPRREGVVMGD